MSENGTPSDQGNTPNSPHAGSSPPGSELATGGADLIPHPITGEAVELGDKSTAELISTLATTLAMHNQIKDFEWAVSAELVDRMDKAASWTLREGHYEVTAPSPAAGVVHYPPDELERVLQELLAEKEITPEAAEQACRRRLVIEVEPPFYLDLRKLAEDVGKSTIYLAGEPMKNMKAEWSVKPSQRGIDALRKVPGVAKALEAVSIAVTPPRRKANVKVKP